VESRYVNLEEVEKMVQEGEEIQIVDARTGEDITSQILAQVVYEKEKKEKHKTPPEFFRQWIREGGETLRQRILRVVGDAEITFHTLRGELETQLKRLLEKGVLTREEANRVIKDLIITGTQRLEEFQKRFDQRWNEFLEKTTPYFQSQQKMEELSRSLVTLKEKVEELEKRIQQLEENKNPRKHGS
jgi:polyhydroxyalkanoate synthesis repressor PhaR